MRVLLPLIVCGTLLLSALPAAAQGFPPGGGPPPTSDAVHRAGYLSQNAWQTAAQQSAAGAVLENTVGYRLADPFGPQIQLNGIFGDRRGIDGNDYSVSALLPWHIDPNRNIVFAILRGTTTDLGDFVGNFGIGQRMYFEDLNRIIGFSGWYDIDDTHNATYRRAGAQMEYIGRYLEVRGGADVVLGNNRTLLAQGFTADDPRFVGNNIAFTFFNRSEFAYDQGYIEAGGPVPFLGRYGLNAYGGAYFLWNDDEREELGWSVRTTAALTRDVNVGFRFTRDGIFGANASVNVAMAFPNGGLKQMFRSPRSIVRGQTPDTSVSNQVLKLRPNSVESQMASFPDRDHRLPVDITRVEHNVLAIDPRTGDAICVIHVDPNAAEFGDGSFEDPFRTLEGARLANDGSCRIIRVIPRDDDSGTNLAITEAFELFDYQRMLASSERHLFTTTRGVFELPGFTGSGPGPLVTNINDGDLIFINDHTEVSGMQLVGSATGNGIVGSPDWFNINRNLIRDGLNGILLTDASGLGLIDENEIRGHDEAGASIEADGERLDLFVGENTVSDNGSGIVNLANDGARFNVVLSENTIEGSTEFVDPTGGNGYLGIADDATLTILSAVDNVIDDNVINGMLLGALNGGSIISIGEDDDGDGVLDPGEDTNGNGILDLGIARNEITNNEWVGIWVRAGEDFNRDGVLSPGEDINGNGVLDSGVGTDVILDIGGPVSSLGNTIAGNLAGGIAFDMLDDSLTTTRIRHNVISFAGGSVGDAIFVMDISGSTTGAFGGTPVGDVNNDGIADTVLDAEIAGFIALNQRLVDLGGGNSSRVALVAFNDQAFQRDMDPAAAGTQLVTFPLTDADGNSIRDVDQALIAEQISGGTDFEEALQASIATFNAVPLTPDDTTLVFLSDGFGGGGFTDEVATLQGLGVNLRAFGVGAGSDLFQLQQIDPNATIVSSTDELLAAFQTQIFDTDAPEVDAVRLTFSDTARLRPSRIADNEISGYGGNGLNVETFNSAEVVDLDLRRNEIRNLGRNGLRLAAADLSRINLTNMTDNILVDNMGNGARFEAINDAMITVAGVSGNMVVGNGENGFFITADGVDGGTATVAGAIGVVGEDINFISGNMGAGIRIEANEGGSILGPGGAADSNFMIVNNEITLNAEGGIAAFGDATAPSLSTLNLTVGGPLVQTDKLVFENPEGNLIDANTDVGIGYVLTGNSDGNLIVLNNEITNTIDDAMMATTPFIGQGIYVEVADTSTLSDSVIDMNTITGNASHGIHGLVHKDAVVTDMLIGNLDGDNDNGNFISSNGGDGIHWQRRDDASVTNMRIIDNTVTNNAINGIHLIASNADTLDTYTVDDNTITGNANDGVLLTVEADADMQVDMDNNFISMNLNDGIGITENVNSGNDSRGVSGTWTNNIITFNEGDGLDFDGATDDLIVGLDGMGNLIDSNMLQAVHITAPGSVTFTDNIMTRNGTGGVHLDAPRTFNDVTLIRNLIADNIGIGVNIDHTAGPGPVSVTLIENDIIFNTGDGLEIEANGTNIGTLFVTSTDNVISWNGERGVDILNAENANSVLSFDDELIRSNGLEGFYVVNTADGSQNQTDAATMMLNDQGAITNRPTLNLTLTNSEIRSNGLDSGFDGTGLVIRVGTSDGRNGPAFISDPGGFASDGRGGIIATVVGNVFAGNNGDDVIIESFVSTVDPITTAGTWDDQDDGDPTNDVFTVTAFQSDPLARLDLDFRLNTGDSVDVTRLGASYNNAEPDFKSRLNQANGGTSPFGPFTSATRRRNAQRQAARELNAFGNFLTPLPGSTLGAAFLYPGVDDDSTGLTGSTFRVTAGSTTAGFGAGDGFGSLVFFPNTIFGELPFEWDIIP